MFKKTACQHFCLHCAWYYLHYCEWLFMDSLAPWQDSINSRWALVRVRTHLPVQQGRTQDFLLEQDGKAEGRDWGWGSWWGGSKPPPQETPSPVLGEGAATPSPPARASGERCEIPSGVRSGSRPPKGFPQFSALMMASPDPIMLLIVDYHAATGGQDPCDSLCVHRCNLVEINS